MKNLDGFSTSEPSLIVPDFTISVYGSSCNYFLFGLILPSLLSLSIYWHPREWMGCQEIDRERKEEKVTNKRELPELPCTEKL